MTSVVHLLSFNLYYTVEFSVVVVNIFVAMGSVIISVNNFIFASFFFFLLFTVDVISLLEGRTALNISLVNT